VQGAWGSLPYARGYRGIDFRGGWLSVAVELGAEREVLKKLMEGKSRKLILREAIEAWEKLDPFSSGGKAEALSTLVWLFHEVGVAGGKLKIYRPCLASYLRAGGSPNAVVDELRNTLLHEAVRGEDVAAVTMLLEAEANPNQANLDGLTPLHLLVMNGYRYKIPGESAEDIFALLISAGADLQLKDKEGLSLVDHLNRSIEIFKKRGRSQESVAGRKRLEDFLRNILDPGFVQHRLIGKLVKL